MNNRRFAVGLYILAGSICLILLGWLVPITSTWLLMHIGLAIFPGALVYMVTQLIKSEKRQRHIHVCCYAFAVGVALVGVGFVVYGLGFGSGFTPVAFLLFGLLLVTVGVVSSFSIAVAVFIHKRQAKRNGGM